MADRMYEEQHKFSFWIVKVFLISLVGTYVLMLLSLPIEMWCAKGINRETFAASLSFLKKASLNPVLVDL